MPKIVFKNIEISCAYEVKFLGINFSNNVKWNHLISIPTNALT